MTSQYCVLDCLIFQVGGIGVDYKRTLSYHKETEKEEYETALSDCHYRSANRLLKLCRDNGGVFIKVGQHIGALDYLLPEEYVSTMKVLHNRAPEMELKQVFAVIREDLKQEVKRTHVYTKNGQFRYGGGQGVNNFNL